MNRGISFTLLTSAAAMTALLSTPVAKAEMSDWGETACVGNACCGEEWFSDDGSPFCGGAPTSPGPTCLDRTSLTIDGETVTESDNRIIVAAYCSDSGWQLGDWSPTSVEFGSQIGASASCPENELLLRRLCIVYVPD